MNWLEGLTINTVKTEMHSTLSQAEDDIETVATNVGGVGGVIAGIAIGSVFGLVGVAVGACLGAKVGAEGIRTGVRCVRKFFNRM
jgi:uncharacterized membrane protein